jgi:hypothetical protein
VLRDYLDRVRAEALPSQPPSAVDAAVAVEIDAAAAAAGVAPRQPTQSEILAAVVSQLSDGGSAAASRGASAAVRDPFPQAPKAAKKEKDKDKEKVSKASAAAQPTSSDSRLSSSTGKSGNSAGHVAVEGFNHARALKGAVGGDAHRPPKSSAGTLGGGGGGGGGTVRGVHGAGGTGSPHKAGVARDGALTSRGTKRERTADDSITHEGRHHHTDRHATVSGEHEGSSMPHTEEHHKKIKRERVADDDPPYDPSDD